MVEPITTPISWFLSKYTNIHPTAITLLRILVLFPLSAILFLFLSPQNYLLGAIAYYLAFISDNIDGHVARATGKTSKTGAILDEVSDRMYFIPIIAMYVAAFRLWPWITVLGLIMLYWRLFRKSMDLIYVEKYRKTEDADGKNIVRENPFEMLDKKLLPILQKINPRIEGIFVRFHFAQLTVLFFVPVIYALIPVPGIYILQAILVLFALGQTALDIKHVSRILNTIKVGEMK